MLLTHTVGVGQLVNPRVLRSPRLPGGEPGIAFGRQAAGRGLRSKPAGNDPISALDGSQRPAQSRDFSTCRPNLHLIERSGTLG